MVNAVETFLRLSRSRAELLKPSRHSSGWCLHLDLFCRENFRADDFQ